MQVIVLGMHRSGTSILSRLLNMMGLYFGAEGSSTGLNIENPKGFWERLDVRALNDFILQDNNLDWNKINEFESVDQFNSDSLKKFHNDAKKLILGMDAFRPWFLKEPRFCLTLPLWKEHLELPLIIFIYRHPLEVAKSLNKRNGFPIRYGLALWERYNQLALDHSDGLPRLILDHKNLIDKPKKILSQIYEFLESNKVDRIRMPGEMELSKFIDRKLHRNVFTREDLGVLNNSQTELLNKLIKNNQLLGHHVSQESLTDLKDYEDIQTTIETLDTNLKDTQSRKDKEIERIKDQLYQKNKELVEVKISYEKILSNELIKQELAEAKRELAVHKKRVDGLSVINSNKDKIINEHWERIQSMRISSRIKKVLFFDVIRQSKNCFLNHLNNFNKKRQLKSKKIHIEKFIQQNFDHSLSIDTPLVSIIILNRNGLNHLQSLFKDFDRNTIYPNYEIIVFDNFSNDDSVSFLENLGLSNLSIIENTYNDSFSSANNKVVAEAKGNLILFLNNDIITVKGWLNQLVKEYLENENQVGSVGAKLIYPENIENPNSLKVQHNGIGFRWEEGFIRPYNLDVSEELFNIDHTKSHDKPCLTAACVLVNKEVFERVGGFDENYMYGFEDVDLSLKLRDIGKKNIIANGAIIYHNEFGTQGKQDKEAVKKRRRLNLNHFRDKWYRRILNESWHDKLNNKNTYALESPKFTIGIIVTEQGKYAKAGDYFTAKELANEFVKLGWKVRFYAQREENWYNIHGDVDMILVLLHGYDLNKVVSNNKNLIKAAWIRNWFDKFSDSDWFNQYDLVFSSSKKACDYIENKKFKKAYYMPIATNEERFSQRDLKSKEFVCDYCFTGSYWNDPREIIEMLDPKNLAQYKFHLYGKNWDQISHLADYSKGFVKYEDMPKVYANTKLLIDDANRVTKPWGSVNSRVFDALMSGTLVVTNGTLGSEDVFKGKLPIFSHAEELEELIKYYLENDAERNKLVEELQQLVRDHHTYQNRASQIKKVLTHYYSSSMVIKIPVPNIEVAHQWGDYHFALSLKKEFEKKNIRTKIELLPDWDSEASLSFENVLVLRGLSVYKPQKSQYNMMWNISHPDKVELDEYRSYDHAFVASEKWKKNLEKEGLNNVSTLLQCTDPEVFKIPKESEQVQSELLFVGNSRGIYRKIIADLLPTQYDLSIYGNGWENLVDNEYVKGGYIDNTELYKYYGGAKVVLNDHWDDMREKGFISNRIFDALACGATLVSDKVEGSEVLRENSLLFYESKEELEKAVKDGIEERGNKKVSDLRKSIIKNHTFEARVMQILEHVMSKKI